MSPLHRMAVVALLLIPLGSFAPHHGAPAAAASEVVVTGENCTVTRSPAEHEDALALSGVFAANWSAEILRDIPAAAEDMASARSWYADKTSDQLTDVPAHVREAVDRVNLAGQRVGYRGEEATAPLRMLVERNDLRRSGRTSQIFSMDQAHQNMDAIRRTGAPAPLSGAQEGLSVPAAESWQRAWDRTPGAQVETEASRAEMRLCTGQTSGSVDRSTADTRQGPSPPLHATLPGVPLGQIHTTTVLKILEEANAFR